MYKIRCYQDVKQPIKETDLVVSMRFHGALLSFIGQKPLLAIAYDEKISSLMTDFQRTPQCLSWNDFASNNETSLNECLEAVEADDLSNIPSIIEELQNKLLGIVNEIL